MRHQGRSTFRRPPLVVAAAVGPATLLSTVLQGCGFGGGGGGSDPDTPTTSTSTTTTTSTTRAHPVRHCKNWEEPTKACIQCEEGFAVVDGDCLYTCQTDMEPFEVTHGSKKGMCMDDTTLSTCADKLPYLWPNSRERISSLRLFTAWRNMWPEADRELAWDSLARYVKAHDVKVLIGTQVSCNETDDDADWKLVLEFVNIIGADHVMGIAVGNELELLFTKDYVRSDKTCIPRLWKGGYLWRKTQQRVADIDAMGKEFELIPITSVFGGAILGGEPFFETPNAMVASYIANATRTWGTRWVFALNVYPYFDPGNILDAGKAHECNKTLKRTTCFAESGCLIHDIVKVMRRKMLSATNTSDHLLWIAETGWSTPMSSTLSTPVRSCTAFSSRQTFENYYKRFMSWDLQLPDADGPDHIFYFTVRDSNNFGLEEHFGLISNCSSLKCKLQEPAAADELELDWSDEGAVIV